MGSPRVEEGTLKVRKGPGSRVAPAHPLHSAPPSLPCPGSGSPAASSPLPSGPLLSRGARSRGLREGGGERGRGKLQRKGTILPEAVLSFSSPP